MQVILEILRDYDFPLYVAEDSNAIIGHKNKEKNKLNGQSHKIEEHFGNRSSISKINYYEYLRIK